MALMLIREMQKENRELTLQGLASLEFARFDQRSKQKIISLSVPGVATIKKGSDYGTPFFKTKINGETFSKPLFIVYIETKYKPFLFFPLLETAKQNKWCGRTLGRAKRQPKSK